MDKPVTLSELKKREKELLRRMTIAYSKNNAEAYDAARTELFSVQDAIYNIEQMLEMAGWKKEDNP
jgi:hypothetical protein